MKLIKRFKAIHGDYYDYSQVSNVNADGVIVIGCPVHGTFNTTVDKHLNGQECIHCFRKRIADTATTRPENKKGTVEDHPYPAVLIR